MPITMDGAPIKPDEPTVAATAPSVPPLPENITWLSVDPRTGEAMVYEAEVAAAVEHAYQTGQEDYSFDINPTLKATVVFCFMVQVTNRGGERPIRRLAREAPAPPPLTRGEAVKAVRQIRAIDAAVAKASTEPLAPPSAPSSPNLKGPAAEPHAAKTGGFANAAAFQPTPELVRVFEHVTAALCEAGPKKSYGFEEGYDDTLELLRPRCRVPPYYANLDQGESIWRRKMLAVAGLRNLLWHGPRIFDDMQAKCFTGNPDAYADHAGPHRMKHFTGNAVDLDTVVLRCHEKATIDRINKQRTDAATAGPPEEVTDPNEVASTPEARTIAVNTARLEIDMFLERYGFKPGSATPEHDRFVAERCLKLPPPETPIDEVTIMIARSNSARGRSALWRYENTGICTYHANVPHLDDVYGALLKAPYHAALGWLLSCDPALASLPEGDAEADPLADALELPRPSAEAAQLYLDDCIADSCYNAKWKAIEGFVQTLLTAADINHVLDELSAANQATFAAIMADDDDGSKELAEMVRLTGNAPVPGDGEAEADRPAFVFGVDPATKLRRRITTADIAAWHESRMKAAGLV